MVLKHLIGVLFCRSRDSNIYSLDQVHQLVEMVLQEVEMVSQAKCLLTSNRQTQQTASFPSIVAVLVK